MILTDSASCGRFASYSERITAKDPGDGPVQLFVRFSEWQSPSDGWLYMDKFGFKNRAELILRVRIRFRGMSTKER